MPHRETPEELLEQGERRRERIRSVEVLNLQVEDVLARVTVLGEKMNDLVAVFTAIAGTMKLGVRVLGCFLLAYVISLAAQNHELLAMFLKWLPSLIKAFS